MPAGRLGREADDRPEEPRAPRGLLVRVALTEGLGGILSGRLRNRADGGATSGDGSQGVATVHS